MHDFTVPQSACGIAATTVVLPDRLSKIFSFGTQYYDPEDATHAKNRLDGYNLDGRNISVLYAQVGSSLVATGTLAQTPALQAHELYKWRSTVRATATAQLFMMHAVMV